MATNDSKVTALTENTAPVLTDYAYMVDDPSGTPLGQLVQLGNLLSLTAGAMTGASGVVSTSGTPATLTIFSATVTIGAGVTASSSTDLITLVATGKYLVAFSLTGSDPDTANLDLIATMYYNGSDTAIGGKTTLVNAADLGFISGVGLIDATVASQDLEVRVSLATGTQNIAYVNASLIAVRLGPT